MKQFEKDVIFVYNGRLDIEDKEMFKRGFFYQDGLMNKLFNMYLLGISLIINNKI